MDYNYRQTGRQITDRQVDGLQTDGQMNNSQTDKDKQTNRHLLTNRVGIKEEHGGSEDGSKHSVM